MAFMEENEGLSNQDKQSNQIYEMLRTVGTIGSKKLDLSRKSIKDIPCELKQLHKLEFLYLEGNSLTCLPDDLFTYLPSLKWLDLRNNHITQLPTTIGESRCLRSLLLENNELTRLPLELGFLQSLSGLHLADNPLEFPSKNIIEQGTQEILAFLRVEWLKMKEDHGDSASCDETYKRKDDTPRINEGKERAPDITAHDEISSLKLPPIKTSISAIHVEATTPESDKPKGLKTGNKPVSNLLHLQKSLTNETSNKNYEISRRESPTKNAAVRSKKGEGVWREGSKSDENGSRIVAKSPKKKQSKSNKKKLKNSKESVTILTAVLNEGGTIDMGYHTEVKEKSLVDKQADESVNVKVAKVMDEEKNRAQIVPEVVAEKRKQRRQSKFAPCDLSIEDMVVMQVPEEHFIPGQPCLGKVVSLPDAIGVLLVHYYSGSFDGIWKPMMSRSSPYFRRVPLSKIIYKFELDQSGRMSKETIEKVKEVLKIKD